MSSKKREFVMFRYSEEDLAKAIEAITQEGLKIREASRKYGVPHSTLISKLQCKTPLERRMGPNTILTRLDEESLEKFILASAKKGFPVSKRRLILLGEEIAGRSLGRKWFDLFLKRHQNISKRHTEAINQARAAVTESSIRKWHNSLKEYLEEYQAIDVLDDPKRIINSDETGFMTNPKTGLVLGPRGEKNFYEVKIGSEKEQITTLLTIGADGHIFPPLVVFPFERVPQKVAQQYNKDWAFGNSKSGWMTSEVFLGFLQNSFVPALKERGVKFPVLYLIDGHKSHLSKEVAEFCEENGVIIYSFRPNATHILQPADVSVFRSLKHKWSEEVEDFRSKNRYVPVTKHNFGTLLEKALANVSTETIVNGFRICGLYPFDCNNIDFTKCMEHTSRKEDGNAKLKPAHIGFSHLLTMESLMQHGRAEEFRKTFNAKSPWLGDDSASELYNLWFKIRSSIDSTEVCQSEQPEKIGLSQQNSETAQRSDSQEELEGSRMQQDLEGVSESSLTISQQKLDESVNSPQLRNSITPQLVLPASEDVSPSFYNAVVWPTDTPPKKKSRVMSFPQGSGARKWLEYYEDKKKKAEEKEAAKQEKILERKRRKEEKEKIKKKAKAAKNIVTDDESSDDEDIEKEILEALPESSGGEWNEQESSDDEIGLNESDFLENVSTVTPSDWVIVEYDGKKNKIYYTGLVKEKVSDSLFTVDFLKKQGSSYIFPPTKDVSPVTLEKIKKTLPMPRITKRGHHFFDVKKPISLQFV